MTVRDAVRRRAMQLFMMAAFVAGVNGCGGGEGKAPSDEFELGRQTCRQSVTSGDGSGGYSDGSGPGEGGEGSGDAGPGLGKFLKAIVRVELADGSFSEEAEIDDTRGVVRFVLCGYQGPVHVKVLGKSDGSTRFYDESTRTYAAFPAGEEMHSVVRKFEKNIGITVLTEAAWRYLLANHGADGWRDAAKVTEANEAIRDEFNRHLPADLRIDDITRLPELLSSDTKAASVQDGANGKYGMVNAGLARAAGLMLTGDTTAALKIARQMGADLCDGKLDYACRGVPVVSNAADAAYVLPQLGSFLNTGIGDVATSCAVPELGDDSLRIVQTRVDLASRRKAYWFLRSDGRLFFQPGEGAAVEPYAPTLRFRQLFTQGPMLGTTFDGKAYRFEYSIAWRLSDPRPFETPSLIQVSATPSAPIAAPEYDGTTAMVSGVYPFPDWQTNTGNLLGTIWPDENTMVAQISRKGGRAFTAKGTATPKDAGLDGVVQVSLTSHAYAGHFAVTADGKAYAWGSNQFGQLGLGRTEADLPEQSTPAAITFAGSPRIQSVTGIVGGGYAVDVFGKVWSWGGMRRGFSGNLSPAKLSEFDSFRPIRQIECAPVSDKCAAVTVDGDLIVWGTYPDGFFGPNQYGPPGKVALPDNRKVVYVGTAGRETFAVLDDGRLVFPDMVEGKPAAPKLVLPTIVPRGSGTTCAPVTPG